jgi:hypothetical protein
MGIICASVLQPGSFGHLQHRIPRLNKRLSASNVCKDQTVPVLAFTSTPGSHLANVKFTTLEQLAIRAPSRAAITVSTVWTVGWLLKDGLQPGWSGFMQSVTRGEDPPACAIDFLPIINLPPNDVNCIFSTLVFIENQAKIMNIPCPCVTFDQPLFVKAMDIALAKKLNVVIRLGGFHVILSFLGSIGILMKGSGLEEVLSVLYGKNVVEQILQGRDYERAVRGHFLVHAALTCLLTSALLPSDSNDSRLAVNFEDPNDVHKYKLDCEEIKALTEIYTHVRERKIWLTSGTEDSDGCMTEQCLHSSSVANFEMKIMNLKTDLSSQSRTSRLWILYMKYIELLKKFLISERTSTWLLHLECLNGMLGLFASTSHVLREISKTVSTNYESVIRISSGIVFTVYSGMHTIRRSDRYWAGLSCDLVIEQTLMKSVKSRAGLTHGRGVHETVRSVWLKTMSECARVNSAMSQLVALHHSTSESIELDKTRIARDIYGRSKNSGLCNRK